MSEYDKIKAQFKAMNKRVKMDSRYSASKPSNEAERFRKTKKRGENKTAWRRRMGA